MVHRMHLPFFMIPSSRQTVNPRSVMLALSSPQILEIGVAASVRALKFEGKLALTGRNLKGVDSVDLGTFYTLECDRSLQVSTAYTMASVGLMATPCRSATPVRVAKLSSSANIARSPVSRSSAHNGESSCSLLNAHFNFCIFSSGLQP
jgi:hypothetical protein